MADYLDLGKRGEALAWNFLRKRGYSLLEKNYRTRLGEVDVIASKEGTLIFVEIKTRRNHHFGLPEEALDFRKRHKLIQMAQSYLQVKHMENSPARFDVLSITWDGDHEPHFNLVEDAFGAEG